jgi:hypothetical protein
VTSSKGEIWIFTGTTDSLGKVGSTLQKVPAGAYTATVTSLTASGYTWDISKGVTSATYTLK